MKNLRNLLVGLLTALTSSLIVIGGVSLALAEGITPTLVPTQLNSELLVSITASLIAQTNNQILPILTSTPTATTTATLIIPTVCPSPKGWQAYTIQMGDTLENLARRYGTSSYKISQGNCLLIDTLLPDTILYLPPAPKPTVTKTRTPLPNAISLPCGQPFGWVRYLVKPDDTLFKLSLSLGVSIARLQSTNCLGNSEFIMAGKILYVPYISEIFPAFSITPQPTAPIKTNTPTRAFIQAPSFTNTPLPATTKAPSPVPATTTAPSPLPATTTAPSSIPATDSAPGPALSDINPPTLVTP